MHIVTLAVQILAICVTYSGCARVLQSDRMSNALGRKTKIHAEKKRFKINVSSTEDNKKSTTKASFPRGCDLLLHKQCSQCTHNQSGALCLRCRKTQFQSGKLPKIWGISVLKAETASIRSHTAVPMLQWRGWGRKGSHRGEFLTNDPNQEALLPGQIQLAITNFVL